MGVSSRDGGSSSGTGGDDHVDGKKQHQGFREKIKNMVKDAFPEAITGEFSPYVCVVILLRTDVDGSCRC